MKNRDQGKALRYINEFMEVSPGTTETEIRMQKLWLTALASDDMNSWSPAQRANIYSTGMALVNLQKNLCKIFDKTH
jgi:hypothetical protein